MNIFKWFKSRAKRVIEDFVAPLFRSGVAAELAWALPKALDIAMRLQSGQLSSADKRTAAIKDLLTEAKNQQISIATSLAATAIELAVQKIKAASAP